MAAEMLVKALRVIWQALRSMDVPAAVMGGLAMSVWKYARTTRDVDLLIGVEAGQSDKMLNCLKELANSSKKRFLQSSLLGN